MKRTLLSTGFMISLGALLLVGSCQKFGKKDTTIVFKQAEGEALASVGDVTLTVEELKQDFLDRQGTFKGAPHLNTEKKRKEYVESQVMQEALWQEALKKGYFDNPKLRNTVKKLVTQQFVRDLLTEAQEKYSPTKEEMKDYYDKNPSHFNHEEAVKMAYLSVPFNKDKAKALKIAQKLQIDASKTVKNSDTREFARLAMRNAQEGKNFGNFSINASETSFMEKAECEAKFGKGSYDMVNSAGTIGDIGPLLSSDDSYYVFMKTGKREKLNQSLEDAESKIKKKLGFEKRGQIYEEKMSEYKAKYNIKIHEDKLALLSPEPGAEGTAVASAQGNAAAPKPGENVPPAVPPAPPVAATAPSGR